MPFDIALEPNEELLLKEFYIPSKKSEPFAFGVSNRALFLPRKKTFAVKDPWYFQRVPLSEVQAVALRRIRPAGVWILSIVMVLSGALTTYWMLGSSNRTPGSRVSGYPIAVFLVGLILPFAARGRYALVVALTSGSFKWHPRITVGSTRKRKRWRFERRFLRHVAGSGYW